MDWEQVLAYVIEAVLGLVVTVAIPYGISLLKKKIDAEKQKAETEEKKFALEVVQGLLDKAKDTVSSCVATVNQTYVDALKKEGTFDKAAQEQAFSTCKNLILSQLSTDAKTAIIDTFGTLEVWVKTQIEEMVRYSK
jgi:hypothetical protein